MNIISETGFDDDIIIDTNKYEIFALSTNLRSYQEFAFIDTGVNQISGDQIETFTLFYPDMVIQDFEGPQINGTYYGLSKFNSTLASINHYGTYLSAGLNETDQTIFVTNTGGFPNSGKLLIGKELVIYNGKTQSSFLNVSRAQNGTLPSTHESGEYLRSLL